MQWVSAPLITPSAMHFPILEPVRPSTLSSHGNPRRAFEVEMTEAAQDMLGKTPPIGDSAIVGVIVGTLKRLRSGEIIACKTTFPAAAIGVLWAWHIVMRFQWQWRAVKKDWWETLAIADPDNRYVILPVQYMRGIADAKLVEKWPHEIIDDIDSGRLPVSPVNSLLRIC